MSNRKQYKPWSPTQTFLLPPSPLEWLPEGHLAHFVLEVVLELDLSGIEGPVQAKDGRGTRPYDPAMMVALLVYGYCVGVFSSRKVERATYEDVAFRVLAGGQHPDHSRIAAFRTDHLDALPGLFVQGYNCQAAVDQEHQIIVGQAVSNKSPDNGNLVPMVEQVRDNCGRAPDKTTADAGYWTPAAPAACEQLGTDIYISTRRHRRTDQDDTITDDPVPEDVSARERMRRKLSTKQGRDTYARRKAVVEPVFGQFKEARGFRRFLLRGQEAVQAEWALVCTTHNLLKLFRFHSLQAA